MTRFISAAAAFCLLWTLPAQAQNTAASATEMPSTAEMPDKQKLPVLTPVVQTVGDSAIANITGAEQVFCYQVTNKPENYTGYTLDGMAMVGFCGVINNELKNMIIGELFKTPENVLFDVTEECVIRPQVILRFVRGVDSTDVLLSSPCYAYAIFYGGKVSAFNAKPAAPIIDALIDPLIKGKIDFASPALLNQLLPIGVAQTDEQKQLLNQKNKPIRNWTQTRQETEAAPKKSGWNNLNLKL